MTYRVVIPARFASQRLPGKPLADINGRPMIVWVAEAVTRSGADELVVATDDDRVFDAVARAGFRAMDTRTDHPSGSDRVMEVVARCGWPEDDVVLNVQGDEPLVPPAVLDQLAASLTDAAGFASATLCEPIARLEDLLNPNVVKVVRDAENRALYFSRAAIPHRRDGWTSNDGAPPADGRWWRHVGVYAYRVWALKRFVSLPTGLLEDLEKLEQLRLLENGMDMRVEQACEPVPGGVDTEADLQR
ncbi:MAG TPA: 3-deoxy-manno-octulosonate cytidylyltransferase, partial [Pseudomonadales bacterium]